MRRKTKSLQPKSFQSFYSVPRVFFAASISFPDLYGSLRLLRLVIFRGPREHEDVFGYPRISSELSTGFRMTR